MFTAIRQYRCDPATVAEVAHRVDEHLADQLAALPGFVAYDVIDSGTGDVFTTATCADRDAAERSSRLAAAFVQEQLAGMGLTQTATHTGEVLVHRASREAIEPVHA